MTDDSPSTEAMLAELSRQQQELVGNIMKGESSGDPVLDFTIRQLREYDAASIARFRDLQQLLAEHQGELVLVSHCWEARYTSAYGTFGSTYGYCILQDLSIGVINGGQLVFGEAADPVIPLHKYPACYLPTGGFLWLQSANISAPFEFFEGEMNLHTEVPFTSEYSPTQGWRWTLDQDQGMSYVGDEHNIRFMSPHVPKWLTIAVGNHVVSEWFESPNGIQVLLDPLLVERLQSGLQQLISELPSELEQVITKFGAKPRSR